MRLCSVALGLVCHYAHLGLYCSVGRVIIVSTDRSAGPGFDLHPRQTEYVKIDIRSSLAWY